MAGLVQRLEACVPALRRYAATLLRNRQEADDLVHDCLERALERLHTRREDGELQTWLFAIMHNLFTNRLRRRRFRWQSASLNTIGEENPGTRTRKEDDKEAADVMGAFHNLPVEQRSVMFLVSVEDLSYAAVAEILGVPIGTVTSLLAEGRERLRQIMNGEAPSVPRRTK